MFLPESTEGIAEGQTTAMGNANAVMKDEIDAVNEAMAEFAAAKEE